MTASFVYITTKNKEEAQRIGRNLVDERLVASVNIFGNITSMYWWDGSVQEASETVLIAKTRHKLVDAVIERIKSLHSYECPCVVSWPIDQANPQYLQWIDAETR